MTKKLGLAGALITALVLGLVGCGSTPAPMDANKTDHPSAPNPAGADAGAEKPGAEHSSSEHPSSEHPSSEHPK